jgi:GDP-D-mannose 3', 5'-epimerase
VKRITKRYNLDGPKGVRGRNSDNSRLRSKLGWEPRIFLRQGLKQTYTWIAQQLREARGLRACESNRYSNYSMYS